MPDLSGNPLREELAARQTRNGFRWLMATVLAVPITWAVMHWTSLGGLTEAAMTFAVTLIVFRLLLRITLTGWLQMVGELLAALTYR